MKRTLFVFVGLFIAGFLFFSAISSIRLSLRPAPISLPAPASISVTIDYGDRIATVSSITAITAFDALQKATQQEKMEIKTKQYDFGVFVEQIGDVANTKEKAWIYFVNGKTGTVAADKQLVVGGDSVEWRYIKPTVE